MSNSELRNLSDHDLLCLYEEQAVKCAVVPTRNAVTVDRLLAMKQELKRRMGNPVENPTIQDDIDMYKRFGTSPLLKKLFDQVIDLRCPACHEKVPITIET